MNITYYEARPSSEKERDLPGATCATAFPVPQEGERPVVYADRVGECYVARKSDEHRKNHGLYLTPISAADFMAGRIKVSGPKLRGLDPAAGAGILCCAAVETLVARDSKPDIINTSKFYVRPLLQAVQERFL